ncbi:hypothetical protein EYF80_051880 [Liparis tanakae]|uniref:Uncharacterized protein n=1 Tax=Liparis tanakae TaxID=230148 RepID=A0A4Z2FAP2_9TELE|nr:hypothetical protein EYF80_051880 [Liparis tanakae]
MNATFLAPPPAEPAVHAEGQFDPRCVKKWAELQCVERSSSQSRDDCAATMGSLHNWCVSNWSLHLVAPLGCST